MPNQLDRLRTVLADRNARQRERVRGGRATLHRVIALRHDADRCGNHRGGVAGLWLVPAALVAVLNCGTGPLEQPVKIIDRDRHAHLTADGLSLVYYRHDERPGGAPGIYRVDLATSDVHALVAAILAGLDLHPQTDSIVYSAYASGEPEPALWLVGRDGGGVRRIAGGGTAPGFRWPAFSADGAHIAWEVRRQADTGLDTARTLWIGEWRNGAIANPRLVGPGGRSAWRPDGAALAVERRRPGGSLPLVIALMDTTGQLLDTLGFGNDPVWRPDGGMLAYLADGVPDRGCLGVCFVVAGGSPEPLSTAFMSFTGGWSSDGAQVVYARRMRTYELPRDPNIRVEESRLWIRTLATGADRQVTF